MKNEIATDYQNTKERTIHNGTIEWGDQKIHNRRWDWQKKNGRRKLKYNGKKQGDSKDIRTVTCNTNKTEQIKITKGDSNIVGEITRRTHELEAKEKNSTRARGGSRKSKTERPNR